MAADRVRHRGVPAGAGLAIRGCGSGVPLLQSDI